MRNFNSVIVALAFLGLCHNLHAAPPVENIAVPFEVNSETFSVSACFSRPADNQDQVRIYGSNGCSGEIISPKNDDGSCASVTLTMIDNTKTCNVKFEGWAKYSIFAFERKNDATRERFIKVKQVVKFTGAPQITTFFAPSYSVTAQAFAYDYATLSGQSVTLESTTTAVCTLAPNGQITHVSAGECILKAEVAGTSVFNQATDFISWDIVPDPDTDGDGVYDYNDNCPSVSNLVDHDNNPSTPKIQPDLDNDGKGDACDTDKDGDGFIDTEENCPYIVNTDPNIFPESSPGVSVTIQACFNNNPDVESPNGDGIPNDVDNCIFVINPDQKDSDGDGKGDACDTDKDGDGVANDVDNCSMIANANQADADVDGTGDACEQVFVSVETGSDLNDCLTWATACKTISKGIDRASANNLKQVFVYEGVYRPASTIQLQAGINLYGGFGVDESTDPKPLRISDQNRVKYPTIISGDINGDDTATDDIVTAVNDIAGTNLTTLLSANGQETDADKNIRIQGFILNAANNTGNAGALLVNDSRVEFFDNQVIANKASNGGGIYAEGGAQVAVAGVTFTGNTATDAGAAMYATGSGTRISVLGATIENNNATNSGGGVFANASSELVLKAVTIKNNQSISGAGLYIEGAKLTVGGLSVLEGNAATASGGALYAQGSQDLSIDQSTITNNSAGTDGGAMLLAVTGNSLINASYIASNTAQSGAAISHAAGSSVIKNSVLYDNAASNNGGAVFVFGGAPDLRQLTIYKNAATNNGGGLYRTGGTLNIAGSIIIDNTAATGGNAHGTINDGGYNLVGFNGLSNLSGGAVFNGTDSFVPTPAQATEADAIIETTPSKQGGDGYFSNILNFPILGGGPARNMIPKAACLESKDLRGENRPDLKDEKCDIGAYEFQVFSCAEDAQRRFLQGERFVKSCDPNLEKYEIKLGYISLSTLLSLLLLSCFMRFVTIRKISG